MTSASRPQLLLPLLNRAAFRERLLDPDADSGSGLFVPGELELRVGDDVDVDIHFHEERVRFHIRAVVRWQRGDLGRRSLPPGVGLAFPPAEERARAQLMAFVDGKDVAHVERETRRYALQVEVKLDVGGTARAAVTDDVSEGGCFVLLDDPPAIGTPVHLKLRAPHALFGWVTVPGVVVWQRFGEGRTGAGVEFRFEGERQQHKVARVVEVLRERLVRQLQVQTARSAPPSSSSSAKPTLVPQPSSMLPRK